MSEDAAPCPDCARTLRLKAEPKERCALTHCPACGASLVFVSGESLVLLSEKAARSWRFRGILREQGVELAGATGSALGFGALLGGAFGLTGHVVAAIATVVAAAVGGAGMSSTIAMDALTGATAWRAQLTHEEDLLALQPEGYRA